MTNIKKLSYFIILFAMSNMVQGGNYNKASLELNGIEDGKTYSSRDIYEIMCSSLDKRIPRWSVPQFLFNVIASISSHLRYRIDKLLGDECYSSKKIQSIGFKAKKTLKDMHETDY